MIVNSSSRLRLFFITACLAALAVGAVMAFSSSSSASARPAPDFSVQDLRDPDNQIRFRRSEGKPTVVNFFASWCVPCRRELPRLEAAHRRHKDRVSFVGINHQDSRYHAIQLLKGAKVSYPSGYDPQGRISSLYRVRGMPTTLFISGDGRVVGEVVGEIEADELTDWINKLTATDEMS